MSNWFSGVVVGAGGLWVYWMSTHTCYMVGSTGLLCNAHPFNLDWLLSGLK